MGKENDTTGSGKGSYVVVDQDGDRVVSEEGRQYFSEDTAREIAKFIQYATGEKISKKKVDKKGKK